MSFIEAKERIWRSWSLCMWSSCSRRPLWSPFSDISLTALVIVMMNKSFDLACLQVLHLSRHKESSDIALELGSRTFGTLYTGEHISIVSKKSETHHTGLSIFHGEHQWDTSLQFSLRPRRITLTRGKR